MRTRPAHALAAGLVVAAAWAAAGCGSDDGGETSATATAPAPAATATEPVASTPAATAPPPQATEPLPPPQEEQDRSSDDALRDDRRDRDDDDGDGGQEPVRVPATFAADGGALRPARVTVPPFLAIELSVASADGAAHTVVVRAPRPQRVAVPAGGRAAVKVPGLRAGEYAVELDGRPAATLVVGGEAGP